MSSGIWNQSNCEKCLWRGKCGDDEVDIVEPCDDWTPCDEYDYYDPEGLNSDSYLSQTSRDEYRISFLEYVHMMDEEDGYNSETAN